MKREATPSKPLTEEQLADNLRAINDGQAPLYVQDLGRCATMQGGSANRTWLPRAATRPTQITGNNLGNGGFNNEGTGPRRPLRG